MFTNDYYKVLSAVCFAFRQFPNSSENVQMRTFVRSFLIKSFIFCSVVFSPHLLYSFSLDRVYCPSVHVHIVSVILVYAFF